MGAEFGERDALAAEFAQKSGDGAMQFHHVEQDVAVFSVDVENAFDAAQGLDV